MTSSSDAGGAAGSSARKRRPGRRTIGGRCPATVFWAAAGGSCASGLLLMVAVTTAAWDSVAFDLALANRTLSAARPLYADAQRSQLAGLVIVPASSAPSNSSSSTGYCLLNLYASLWSLCDIVNKADPINQDYNTYCSKYSMLIRNNTCFSYIGNYNEIRSLLDSTENTSESQIMKMQNNAMACCIVVLLCVAAGIVTGLIGILGRVVPSIMVTGVLHLTAGIFIIFSNSIQHEKTSRMMRKPQIDVCPQCVCYSLVKTPEQFCNSTYRTVSIGWSVAVSWLAAVAYLMSSACWLALTRRVRIEKSKTMV